MRNFALLAALVVGNCATAQPLDPAPRPAFDLDTCARRATDIVVVDRRGRVVDVWKGHLALGHVIPLDKVLSPALPQHADVPMDPFTRLSCNWHEQLHARERYILFLVKSSIPLPAVPKETAFDEIDCNSETAPKRDHFGYFTELGYFSGDRWDEQRKAEQSARRVARDGWLSASPHGWFACSMAYVDDFGLVRTREVVPVLNGSLWFKGPTHVPTWTIAGTEETFKQRVLEAAWPMRCG